MLAYILTSVAWSQSAPMPPQTKEYLLHTINVIRSHAPDPKNIDWVQIKDEAIARALHAQTPADTYPAIVYVCRQLMSQQACWNFRAPDSASSEVQASVINAWRQPLDSSRREITELPPSPFKDRSEPDGFLLQDDHGRTYAGIIVPKCIGPFADAARNQTYDQLWAGKLHSLVMQAAKAQPHGWIIDLRGNQGGNMWSMLAGIGNLIGEGEIGSFRTYSREDFWYYKDGTAGIQNRIAGSMTSSSTAMASVGRGNPLWDGMPVAVLFDNGTAASGEAVAVAFEGRTHIRTFGLHTYGASSCCESVKLSDNATLSLPWGIYVDRRGREYLEGLSPDDKVITTKQSKPIEDPAVGSALTWLEAQ